MPTVLKRPVVAEVERGGEVEIPISVVASPGDQVRIEVSSPSAFGTVSITRPISPTVPLLHYISKRDTKVAEDSFRFRIKASGYAWNTYSAQILIKNPKGILKMEPEKIDFGHVPLGSVSTAGLTIYHKFGADISGKLLVPAPYSISGGGVFSLAEGQSTNLTITFAPNEIQSCPAHVRLTPSSPGIKEIPIIGDGCAPFGINTNVFTISDRIKQSYVQVTNFTSNSLSLRWTDDSPLHFESLQIGPHESGRVALSGPQLDLPAGSMEIFYPRLGNSFYSIPITIVVNGPPGRILVETIKSPTAFYSLGQTILLKGIIHNDTTNEGNAELVLSQHDVDGIVRSSVKVLPSSNIPFEIPWTPKNSGLTPIVVQLVVNGEKVSEGNWSVTINKQTEETHITYPLAESSGKPPDVECQTPLYGQSRLATKDERDSVAIWAPPTFSNGLLGSKLILNWSYFGSESIDFTIEEKRHRNVLIDRTGEAPLDSWIKVHGKPKLLGQGWQLEIPLPYPGIHTYRVYPNKVGNISIAEQSITVTWRLYLWTYLRLLLITIITLSAIFWIRYRISK
jgi:hypothetical protein